MAIQPMALGVQNPQINAVQAMAEGQQAGQQQQMNQINIAKANLAGIAQMAHNTGGDPAKWEQGLDMLETAGLPVQSFRGRADLAPLVAKSAFSAAEQVAIAQDERSYALALRKFEQELVEAAKGPKTSLNLSYGQDAQGNVVPLQARSDGTMAATQLPEGITLATKADKIDLGTDWGILDPLTRQVVERVPKENYQEQYDRTAGGERAKLDIEKPAMARKAQGALSTLARKTSIVTQDVDKAIKQADSVFSTGFLSDWVSAVKGTPAYDLSQTLQTIKANIGFDALQQMRENSPTGGALGAVSDTENALLQAVNGALAQGQSKEQFVSNLARVKELQLQVLQEKQAAYASDFGDTGAQPVRATPGPSIADGAIIENDAGERMVLHNGQWEKM